MAGNGIYFAFSAPPATGGDFVTLEHILALDRMGFRAQALYCAEDEGLDKFSVPVLRMVKPLGPDDIIVISEVQHGVAEDIRAWPCAKVLHNQNPYFTFFGFESIPKLNAYPFARVIVPSDFCAARLVELGVRHPISRVRPSLPPVFKPGRKQLRIAFSPRKRWTEAHYLWGCFQAKAPEYAAVPWLPLNGMERDQCAAIMADCAVYAAFAQLESLGLMSLEAMASGCHVVGYTGHGGREYATPANGDWIEEGDHDAFVAGLREACRLFESGQANPRIEAGRATAAAFNRENFLAELRAAWTLILGTRMAQYRK